jgi:hypothetical protein
MNEVMVDLETFGTSDNAAIVSIGAVEFDLATKTIGRTFYRNISLSSAVVDGGQVDGGTIIWWLQQSEAARQALFQNPGDTRDVLNEFATWMREGNCVNVWGNGAVFDNVILGNAFNRSKITKPWTHRGDRCYRTMAALAGTKPDRTVGTHHNALDDAMAQTKHLLSMFP